MRLHPARPVDRLAAAAPLLTIALAACAPPPIEPVPPDSFAFAVFGDGPYRSWEMGRFRAVLNEIDAADLAWFLHVGDILWYPCSEEAYRDRLRALEGVRVPVVYTPGDNEWADCHDRIAGGYEPLDRLRLLRGIFWPDSGGSLGAGLDLETQAADTAWAEFVENARWRRGGFVFATVHIVGAGNASAAFPGRTEANDREAARRTAAGAAWIDGTFDRAEASDAAGVVLAFHADPWFDEEERPAPFDTLLGRIARRARSFDGPVLLIHGDSHDFIVDRPLRDPETGAAVENVTRLETMGAPDIGWVRVVVDTVRGRFTAFQPRTMPLWRLR